MTETEVAGMQHQVARERAVPSAQTRGEIVEDAFHANVAEQGRSGTPRRGGFPTALSRAAAPSGLANTTEIRAFTGWLSARRAVGKPPLLDLSRLCVFA